MIKERYTAKTYVCIVTDVYKIFGCEYIQSCLTLCDPMNCNSPGFSVHEAVLAELWSGLPFSPPGDLPNPGIKPASPVAPELQVDSLPLSNLGSPKIFSYHTLKQSKPEEVGWVAISPLPFHRWGNWGLGTWFSRLILQVSLRASTQAHCNISSTSLVIVASITRT